LRSICIPNTSDAIISNPLIAFYKVKHVSI
jgi:hypothetical protein